MQQPPLTLLLLLVAVRMLPVTTRAHEIATPAPHAFLRATNPQHQAEKQEKICSIAGGALASRRASSGLEKLLLDALDDVELMREFWTETMKYKPDSTSITLEALSQTLDWQARDFLEFYTTVDAGLDWVDDARDRRTELLMYDSTDEPYVGNKSSDLAMLDLMTGILPWMVDRRSKETQWHLKDHQNGRSEGPNRPTMAYDRLYIAAYAVSWGGGTAYYPPLSAAGPPYGLNLVDITGKNFSLQSWTALVGPTLRENNPDKLATVGQPYVDLASGLYILTIQAPVYYTGSWYGFDNYNDTYLGLVGIDVSVASLSSRLAELDGASSNQSFGVLVDASFQVYVITQYGVDRIYPQRTGMEDFRVARDVITGDILEDRRNQTYTVRDTFLQPLVHLTNANWTTLMENMAQEEPGSQGTAEMDITLTGDQQPTAYYVMYEKWAVVGDFMFLLFAPKTEVDTAIQCDFETPDISIQANVGREATGQAVFVNTGVFDLTVTLKSIPKWIRLDGDLPIGTLSRLAAGDEWNLPFTAITNGLSGGNTTGVLTVMVSDDDYRNCFYTEVFSVSITMQVVEDQDLNQLELLSIFGFLLSAMTMATSVACAIWVMLKSSCVIIRASQPFFLYLVCFGTFIMGASLIPLSIDDSLASTRVCDAACMAFPWTLALGFSITFAALFSKVWRINRLMTAAANLRREKVRPQDVMIPFSIIIVLNLVVLLSWTLMDPLKWERVVTSPSSSYGTCWSSLSAVQLTFLVLLGLVNYSALLMANFQAYHSRNIPDEFCESRYIFFANFGMLQVSMISLPVMFLVVDKPAAFFVIQSTVVCAIAVPLQVWIFAPKLHHVLSHSQASSRQLISQATKRSARTSSNGLQDHGRKSNPSESANFSSGHQRSSMPSETFKSFADENG